MAAAAGTLLEADPEKLTFADGLVTTLDGGSMRITDLVREIYTTAIANPAITEMQLEATRTYAPTNLLHVPDEAGRVSPYPTFSNSAHVCQVEVDAGTGLVTVVSYAAVDDCGTVINPLLVSSQALGAIAMGISGALWEDLPYGDDGRPRATSFKNYLLPRAPDLPEIRLGSHVTPSPFTLLGTKGAGEGGLAGAVAALANAVNDALAPRGAKIHRMPLSAPRVLDALRAAVAR
jgi:carbon-monoxide dehydrogenase large subunit